MDQKSDSNVLDVSLDSLIAMRDDKKEYGNRGRPNNRGRGPVGNRRAYDNNNSGYNNNARVPRGADMSQRIGNLMHLPSVSVSEIAAQPLQNRVLKVSSTSQSKNVAGSIAHISRVGDSPSLLATGALSVNQCIKAIAIGRKYLEEEMIDLRCYPEQRDNTQSSFSFVLAKSKRVRKSEDGDYQEVKVSRNTKPGSTAGAIKAMVLAGKRVAVVAIGADSVLQAAHAIAIARNYLQKEGCDISFRPDFQHIKLDDEREISAVRLHILVQQI
eukprot:TRINITY_DN140_c0_g2_i5.p1 TRINITY_DN140_c0_g2~~TRINITY_DN140_c0_g2_i5.p1  ORF type:complete len:308 (+),score=126.14 TRINITY_DN140_c0_g2_i5:113-925(+)